MSSTAVNSLSNSYVQQTLASALQSAGIAQNSTSVIGAAPASSTSDSSGLSPFARLAGALQQLQQSNPTKYAQVTAQISTNLQRAAQTAESQGNTSAASQLTQLAKDFSTASSTGQLPNLQDLSQAVGGHGGHHHHHHAESSSSSDSDATAASESTSSSPPLNQLLTALQSSDQPAQTGQNSSSDASAVILQTLSNAGINVSGN